MANLKEIRTRITSVKSTKQITSAMKMVSAAKLKKAQDAVINLRPYAGKLHQILFHINKTIDQEEENIYCRNEIPERILIVSITSNKGLCGAFNANVIKQVTTLINDDYSSENKAGNVSIFSIGKKGSEFFHSKGYQLLGFNNHILDNLNFEITVPISEDILRRYLKKEFDKVILVYNKFKNAAVQILSVVQYLPIEIPTDFKTDESFDYIFEPTKEYIVKELIPKSLKIQLYEAVLESVAAEHGARMTAMHKATDNATGLIKELQLHYNKARQAAITNEILEIVGGAEALKK
ncbi:MAG TPA: ATP synthase F1 subunit gamma [Bacteroidales bacterium]|jgi:F-type H+-transporting ATPase subunit gamma|nr:ATP synthase F1 subunit gamma [Bacteroidales bacterium]